MSDSTYNYGYDPIRIEMLWTRTNDAVEALRSIHSDDPLAAEAVRAARLMLQNLEESWLPLVNAIRASRAMVAWRRSANLAALLAWSSRAQFGAGTINPANSDPAQGDLIGAGSGGVGPIGALTRWIRSAGLDDLSDADLARRLDEVLDRCVDTSQRGGDLLAVWAYLGRLADEAAHRLAADGGTTHVAGNRFGDGPPAGGTFAEVLSSTIGLDGIDRIVRALDTAGEITDLDLLADSDDTRLANGRLQASLGAVLGMISATDPAARDHLLTLAPGSSHLAAAVAASPASFGEPFVLALTTRLFTSVTGDGDWRPTLTDPFRAISTILPTVAESPASALSLLADPAVREVLTTDHRLEPDSVEAVVAAALRAPSDDPVLLGDGLQVLADLIEVATRRKLNAGTRRGIAVSLGTYLPAISIQLRSNLPLDVTVRRADASTPGGAGDTTRRQVVRRDRRPAGRRVVRLGTYDEVAAMLGQVVDDRDAQLALGVTVGAFRVDQQDRALASIHADPDLDPHAAAFQIAAELADATRVIELVTVSADKHNELLAFHHGLGQARAESVLSLVEMAVSVLPAGRAVAHASRLTTAGLSAAIGSTTPPAVPDTGFDSELEMHFTVTVLAAAIRDPELRERLGVDPTPDTAWRELEGLIDRFDNAVDLDERSLIRSKIISVADEHAPLKRYLSTMDSLSGNSALN